MRDYRSVLRASHYISVRTILLGRCLPLNDCDWYIPDNHLDAYGLVGGHVQLTDGSGNGALRIHLAIRAAYPSGTCGACL